MTQQRVAQRLIQSLSRQFKPWWLVCLWLAFSPQAFAMKQCPQEFGPKDPAVNATGWLVVGLSVVIGAALVYFTVTKTRQLRPLKRIAIVALSLGGMLTLGIAGLALARGFFFWTC